MIVQIPSPQPNGQDAAMRHNHSGFESHWSSRCGGLSQRAKVKALQLARFNADSVDIPDCEPCCADNPLQLWYQDDSLGVVLPGNRR